MATADHKCLKMPTGGTAYGRREDIKFQEKPSWAINGAGRLDGPCASKSQSGNALPVKVIKYGYGRSRALMPTGGTAYGHGEGILLSLLIRLKPSL